MTTWRLVTALVAAVLPAGCTHAPSPDQLFSPAELSDVVTDRTLYIPSCCNTPHGMLVYLAKGGTGWLDSGMMPGSPPTPGGMSIIFDWRVMDGSRVCFWATPRIGDMLSFLPAFSECLQVLRLSVPFDRYKVTVMQGSDFRSGWLELYSFNAFPGPVIDQYLLQVRVLYGGGIPTWPVPGQRERIPIRGSKSYYDFGSDSS
jgi:hypothetical protein